uniref:Uncharacterized protein n=1 Tax=Glossina austeni TaxID=7395 RepID=A0A1A9V309_GLOAU
MQHLVNIKSSKITAILQQRAKLSFCEGEMVELIWFKLKFDGNEESLIFGKSKCTIPLDFDAKLSRIVRFFVSRSQISNAITVSIIMDMVDIFDLFVPFVGLK